MAGKKIIALVLVLAMAVQTFACGKPSDSGKNEVAAIKHPYGYKKYSCYQKSAGGDVQKHLSVEYENYGTERTRKLYYEDSDEPYRITKWYYNNTGDLLLKKVDWRKHSATESYEYDTRGRLIRYSTKWEDPDDEYYWDYSCSILSLPDEYFEYSKKPGLNTPEENFALERSVTELVTEYTYKGDTDSYKTIRTLDNKGHEICSMELGEEDIVLSKIIYGMYGQYTEEYDPSTRKSAGTYKSDGEVINITKEYDELGRCVKREYQQLDTSGYNVRREGLYDYYSDHYEFTESYYYGDENAPLYMVTRERINKDGQTLQEDSEYYDNDGWMSSHYRYTYTYHENGETASSLLESSSYYDYGESPELEKQYEVVYNEDGDLIKYIYYNYGSETNDEYSSETEVTKEQTAMGTVKHFRERSLNNSSTSEKDYVHLPEMDDPDDMEWVKFSEKSDYSGIEYITAVAEYTDDGKLKRIEYLKEANSVEEAREQGYEYREFDEKGRTIRYGSQYTPDDLGGFFTEYYTWEYWEK